MKKLEFDIYIGSSMIAGQADNIVAIAKPKFFVPYGKYYLNGSEKKNGIECFTRIYDIGTYIADWIDFIEDESKIIATVHLNILSLKKVFKGKEIVTIIDKIENNKNYQTIRDFTEIDIRR